MNMSRLRINIPGWIAVACLLFMWEMILLPKSMKPLLPVFDEIGPLGPFFWLVPLAMILLPIVAAKRGSKCWWAVTVAVVITLFVVLRVSLH
jgi:hypothetical protein